MSYKLFIDDLRDPVTNDWKIARSSAEAKDIVVEFGIPNEISILKGKTNVHHSQ